jgi:5'-AMP-activated protein kinase, catalytic alpha subunit
LLPRRPRTRSSSLQYIVTSTLGQGTFGKVKLATHQETGLEYAIKILDKSDIKANELTVNVRREIAIMKALSHQNIVNLREVLSSKSKLYIVMDLVRGGELFEMIERRGELDEKLARKYFQQLVDAVDYCHRRGVCHRDLKPENLLVDESGCLKVGIWSSTWYEER